MTEPLRAIVIEDDFLLIESLRDGLAKLGCEVLACSASLGEGLQLAGDSDCDFAIVDLNLKGELAGPVLDRLEDRGVPFLLATGAYEADIPARHVDAPRLSKPYDLRELEQSIKRLAQEIRSPAAN